MSNQTNIANIAISLLEIPITDDLIGDFGIVYHPFFNSIAATDNDGIFDITQDKDRLNRYIETLKGYIKGAEDVASIMMLVNKPYQMFYLSLIEKYMDNSTFSELSVTVIS